MIFRSLLGVCFVVMLTGCATFGANKNSQQDQVQTRVTELEKRIEEKDSEIVDLQYQVKDLSSKVGSKESSDVSMDDSASDHSSKASSGAYSDEIVRVNASVEDIQTALKKAGNYTGKIDGKLGPGTKQAIVEYQKEHHLTADGILGKRTWKSLKSYLKE